MLNEDGEAELKMGSAAERIVVEDRFSTEDVLTLSLRVTDPEVATDLLRHRDGPNREQYALSALRLGVLALRQANGSIDAERIRSEGERLVSDVRTTLGEHANTLGAKLSSAIAQYFDPQTGDLTQRLDRLVRKDGDLETVLARHLDGEASSLARTLAEYVGETSPIFKQLSPVDGDGFLATLQRAIEETLQAQRDHILRQFSLDDKDSALSRLVVEITDTNGKLRDELAEDIEVVRKEFSLDQPDGALSRLVKRVDETTQQVRKSLTLDDDTSPLACLRRELLDVIGKLNDANTKFHTEVRSTLEALQARRTEAAQSTRHGLEFQDAVGQLLGQLTRNSDDIIEAVGHTVGRIPRCKVGDFVLTLGPETAAPNAGIVFEAKEDRSYDLRKTVEELARARENRAAQVGVAVVSRVTAPEGMESLTRVGSDIIVIWDRDDASSDVLFTAALSLARALVVRERSQQERVQAEFTAIEDAVRRITKAAESLSEIVTMAGTVRSHGDKIRTRAERLQEDIDQQLAVLRQNVEGLKQHASDEAAAA
jgi:gas vesicle protein